MRKNGKWKHQSLSKLLIPNIQNKIKHRNKNSLDYRRSNLYYGNIYHDKNDYYEVECFNGERFKIDKDDFLICQKYVWKVNNSRDYKSVVTKHKGKIIKLHRLLMDCIDDDREIDHINRVPTDNRRENLRFASRSLNCFNRDMSKYNTSGAIGVYKIHDYERWGV